MSRWIGWRRRLVGMLALGVGFWYLQWLYANANWSFWIWTVPFLVTNTMLVLMLVVSLINNWVHGEVTGQLKADNPRLPYVGVIIPTVNEAVDIVERTVKSILNGSYPQGLLTIILSDDGARSSRDRRHLMLSLVHRLVLEYPHVDLHYVEVPQHGDFKAGNLNESLRYLREIRPDIQYVETRDCDDLIGNPDFLKFAVSNLLSDASLAFVQARKKYARLHKGDMMGTQDKPFFSINMKAREMGNAVFPCGSGVVYRVSAIQSIGGFDATGPVEDFRTGYALLKKGWQGKYITITGAVGQISPENLGEVVKQRGTWAMDTVNKLVFDSPLWTKGLSLKQRLQFLELLLFYLFSFGMVVLMVTPILALGFDLYPVTTTQMDYGLHFLPFFAAVEAFQFSLYEGLSFESIWRSRRIWIAMAPVFATASMKAILIGPHRRPKYQVTHKVNVYRFYWRESWFQWTVSILLVLTSIWQVKTHDLLKYADLTSIVWAGYFICALVPTTVGSLKGVNIPKEVAKMAVMTTRRGVSYAMTPRYALLTVVLSIVTSVSIMGYVFMSNNSRAAEQLAVSHQVTASMIQNGNCDMSQFDTFGVGAYTDQTPYDGFVGVQNTENLLQHDVRYTLWFQAMGDSDSGFAKDWVTAAHDKGFVPVITLEPWKRTFDNRLSPQPDYSFQAIVNGNFDTYFHKWAADARDTGFPIILRFAQEQSTPQGSVQWYPWQGDPVGYKAAFRHIVDIFRAEGARNVCHIWSAMWLDQDSAWQYYPGADYTDLIGTTVLNHGTVPTGWGEWRPFDYLYSSQYERIVRDAPGKPVFITELASAEQGGSKPQWLARVVQSISTVYTQTKGIFLLEVPVDREWPAIDWRVESSQASLDAFKQALQQYFG